MLERNIIPGASLLRLMQLVSPALPVGAYAYSQGLEHAVTAAWAHDEQSAADWIMGVMGHGMKQLDLPVLARLHEAVLTDDVEAFCYWNRFLYASRETRELQKEERDMGAALARLLRDLEVTDLNHWRDQAPATYVAMYAIAAVNWQVPMLEACYGYLWSWCENQVASAIKIVPLGQTAGQRILSIAAERIPDVVGQAIMVDEQDIGAASPALAIGSALHETQYSRLFRS